ncbi:MAG: hypothetical protein KC656_11940 [Myxococcales bacterium]|nr:hypothetical protein [Myxococcales bacterium]
MADPSALAVVAVALRELGRSPAEPARLADWVGRIHALLATHAVDRGGVALHTGLDVAVATFGSADAALAAALAIRDEVEAAREPSEHQHGDLLGIGVAFGPTSAGFGPPHVRALRLALLASDRGEILVDAPTLGAGVPEGFGAHAARVEVAQRIGFPHHRLADYR